jgi:hypothetical protein
MIIGVAASPVATAAAVFRTCIDCGGERAFVQPPCEEGHGVDCPDWVCVECGAAVLIGALTPSGRADRAGAPRRFVPDLRRTA